jgi:hypothetical protein
MPPKANPLGLPCPICHKSADEINRWRKAGQGPQGDIWHCNRCSLRQARRLNVFPLQVQPPVVAAPRPRHHIPRRRQSPSSSDSKTVSLAPSSDTPSTSLPASESQTSNVVSPAHQVPTALSSDDAEDSQSSLPESLSNHDVGAASSSSAAHHTPSSQADDSQPSEVSNPHHTPSPGLIQLDNIVLGIVAKIREVDEYHEEAIRIAELNRMERESIRATSLMTVDEYFNSFQPDPHSSGIEGITMAPLYGNALPEEGVAPGLLEVRTPAERNELMARFIAALSIIDRTRSGRLVGIAAITNIQDSHYHMSVGWTPQNRRVWSKLYVVRHHHLYVPRTGGDVHNRPERQLFMGECVIYGDTLPSLIEHACGWRMIGAAIIERENLPIQHTDSWIVFEGIKSVFVRGNIMDLTRFDEMKAAIEEVVRQLHATAQLRGEDILGWTSNELRIAVLNHPIYRQLLPRMNPGFRF